MLKSLHQSHLCAVCPWTWRPWRPGGSWSKRRPLRSASRQDHIQSGSWTRPEERRTTGEKQTYYKIMSSCPLTQQHNKLQCVHHVYFYLHNVLSRHLERKTSHVDVVQRDSRALRGSWSSRHISLHQDKLLLVTTAAKLSTDSKKMALSWKTILTLTLTVNMADV